MNTILFALVLCGAISTAAPSSAQTPVPPPTAERQALMKQLDRLMQHPHNPNQQVRLVLSGCHAEQRISDKKADVEMTKPVAVSYSNGKSGWAANLANGLFELSIGFEWADVTALTYAPETDKEGHQHYQLSIARRSGTSQTTLSLPLYTTNEATVKEVVGRLEKIRNSCRE